MAYVVRLMERALNDPAYLYERVDAENSEAAAQWFNRPEEAIYSLEVQPARCPLTPESNSYRPYFTGADLMYIG